MFETRFARQDPHRSKILTPPLWPKFTIFCPKIVKTFSVRNQSNIFHRPILKDVFRMEFVQLVFVFKVFALGTIHLRRWHVLVRRGAPIANVCRCLGGRGLRIADVSNI